MKKSWGKPIVQVQLFVPQDCIAACQPITSVRYLDYLTTRHGSFFTGYTYDKGYYDSGEDFNGGSSTSYSVEPGQKENVYGYNAYDDGWFSDNHYIGTPIFFPVVDIRQEGGSSWRPRYVPYNATS